jgi:hypothetical protein
MKPLVVPPLDHAQVVRVAALTVRIVALVGTRSEPKATPLLADFRQLTGLALDAQNFRSAKSIFSAALGRQGPESKMFAECCLRHAAGAPPLDDGEAAGALITLRRRCLTVSEGHYLLRRLEQTFPGRPVAETAVFGDGPIEAIFAHLRDGTALPAPAQGEAHDAVARATPDVGAAEVGQLTAVAERIIDLLDSGAADEADALIASFARTTGASMSRGDFQAIPGAMRVRDAVEAALLAGRAAHVPRKQCVLLDLVLRITSGGAYQGSRPREAQIHDWLRRLDDAVPYPHASASDLIFQEDLSPDEVVERLIRHEAPWGNADAAQ